MVSYIHGWSGPRTCSTSLMYAFHERSDVDDCLDEPLYASFLTHTGADRPYKSLVLEQQNADGNAVVSEWLARGQQQATTPSSPSSAAAAAAAAAATSRRLTYVKHMSKHVAGLDPAALQSLLRDPAGRHFLLVRDPYSVIQSFSKVLPPTLDETGFPSLLHIYSELRRLRGSPPPILLSSDLTQSPEGTLRALCAALDLPFDEKMLCWEPGPRPFDGPWSPWWYGTTHRSTGFRGGGMRDLTVHATAGSGGGGGGGGEASGVLSDDAYALLEACQPIYELFKAKALRPLDPSTTPTPALPATHTFAPDPRNDRILVGIRDGSRGPRTHLDLTPRALARAHVLESAFLLGDGLWEGIRVHKGVALFLDRHLERLWEGAAGIDLKLDLTPDALTALIYRTLRANGMTGMTPTAAPAPAAAGVGEEREGKGEGKGEGTGASADADAGSGVHIRLMVSRGRKPTPHQDPSLTEGAPTVVILPEYKRIVRSEAHAQGISLFTVHVRRPGPDVQDARWNSHSKLNCIAACVQARAAQADEALMLDPQGFVATCNSTNFFAVSRRGVVLTAPGSYLMNGITRSLVLELCARNGIPHKEELFPLTVAYAAAEAFVTGTGGGLTPVRRIDGRELDGAPGPVTRRLHQLYAALQDAEAAAARVNGVGVQPQPPGEA